MGTCHKKFIDQTIIMLRIKYPFLTNSQIRGKASEIWRKENKRACSNSFQINMKTRIHHNGSMEVESQTQTHIFKKKKNLKATKKCVRFSDQVSEEMDQPRYKITWSYRRASLDPSGITEPDPNLSFTDELTNIINVRQKYICKGISKKFTYLGERNGTQKSSDVLETKRTNSSNKAPRLVKVGRKLFDFENSFYQPVSTAKEIVCVPEVEKITDQPSSIQRESISVVCPKGKKLAVNSKEKENRENEDPIYSENFITVHPQDKNQENAQSDNVVNTRRAANMHYLFNSPKENLIMDVYPEDREHVKQLLVENEDPYPKRSINYEHECRHKIFTNITSVAKTYSRAFARTEKTINKLHLYSIHMSRISEKASCTKALSIYTDCQVLSPDIEKVHNASQCSEVHPTNDRTLSPCSQKASEIHSQSHDSNVHANVQTEIINTGDQDEQYNEENSDSEESQNTGAFISRSTYNLKSKHKVHSTYFQEDSDDSARNLHSSPESTSNDLFSTLQSIDAINTTDLSKITESESTHPLPASTTVEISTSPLRKTDLYPMHKSKTPEKASYAKSLPICSVFSSDCHKIISSCDSKKIHDSSQVDHKLQSTDVQPTNGISYKLCSQEAPEVHRRIGDSDVHASGETKFTNPGEQEEKSSNSEESPSFGAIISRSAYNLKNKHKVHSTYFDADSDDSAHDLNSSLESTSNDLSKITESKSIHPLPAPTAAKISTSPLRKTDLYPMHKSNIPEKASYAKSLPICSVFSSDCHKIVSSCDSKKRHELSQVDHKLQSTEVQPTNGITFKLCGREAPEVHRIIGDSDMHASGETEFTNPGEQEEKSSNSEESPRFGATISRSAYNLKNKHKVYSECIGVDPDESDHDLHSSPESTNNDLSSTLLPCDDTHLCLSKNTEPNEVPRKTCSTDPIPKPSTVNTYGNAVNIFNRFSSRRASSIDNKFDMLFAYAHQQSTKCGNREMQLLVQHDESVDFANKENSLHNANLKTKKNKIQLSEHLIIEKSRIVFQQLGRPNDHSSGSEDDIFENSIFKVRKQVSHSDSVPECEDWFSIEPSKTRKKYLGKGLLCELFEP